MSLQNMADCADDLAARAASLQPMLEAALESCSKGSALHNELVAMKCAVAGIKMQGIKLHSLAGTARMTGDLPPRGRIEALPLFQPPGQQQRTLSADELMNRFPDHRSAAANDHTLDD